MVGLTTASETGEMVKRACRVKASVSVARRSRHLVPPETAGLHAQRIASLRGTAKWLFDVLLRGYVSSFAGDTWRETCSTEELFDSYRAWVTETKENFPSDRYAVGKFLASMFQPVRPRVKQAEDGKRPPSYRLGSLTDARRVFSATQGIGDAWPEDDAG
jgi:hypothetical protein